MLHRKRKRLTALLLLLLLFGSSYGLYRAIRTPPELKKVRQLQQQFASADAKNWNGEQRQAKFQEMRTAMQELSTDQREILAAERQQHMQTEMERYAKMTATEKVRYLDEQIDRSERMRQQFMARQGNTPRPPASNPNSTNGNGPPRGSSTNRTPEEREKRRKESLDRTTPEYRALRDQFRKDIETRRKQRGLLR